MWVEEYLKIAYSSSKGSQILNEVNQRSVAIFNQPSIISYPPLRIALVPLFPDLRRFKQGQNFQQWTGNNSKAFMKVSAPKLNSTCILNLNRSSSQHWKASFPSTSPRLSQHSQIFVISHVRRCSLKTHWMPLIMPSGSSTTTAKSSRKLVYA